MQLFPINDNNHMSVSVSEKNKKLAIAGLVIITLISYLRVIFNEFICYDDLQNIISIRELTNKSLLGVFSPVFIPYWDPIARLLYVFNLTVAGETPYMFHFMSMLLHVLNVVFLFEILVSIKVRILTGSFIALLFAVHPINVETVAWVSAVNNLLSTCFIMLSVSAYIEYLTSRTISRYSQVVLFMALGLMSKPSAVILPIILIFIDLSVLNRVDWHIDNGKTRLFNHLFYNKLPLFIITIVYVIFTLGVTKSSLLTNYIFIGKFEAPFLYRIENAIISYVIYLGKMLCPLELSIFYPPQSAYPLWQVLGSGLILVCLSVIAVLQSNKRPWIIFGWLWYLIMMFPSIGLFRQGVWPEHADRYAYIPFIGLFIIIAFLVQEMLDTERIAKATVTGLAAIIIIIFVIMTNKQIALWNNSISLFENSAKVSPNNILAYTLLGDEYYLKGDYKNAHRVDEISKKLNPKFVNYGLTRAVGSYYKKRYSEAITRLERLHFIDPENLDGLYYLALSNKMLNRYDKSVSYFEEYLKKVIASGSADNQYVESVKKEIDTLKSLKRANN